LQEKNTPGNTATTIELQIETLGSEIRTQIEAIAQEYELPYRN
jgi:hypothetical protein